MNSLIPRPARLFRRADAAPIAEPDQAKRNRVTEEHFEYVASLELQCRDQIEKLNLAAVEIATLTHCNESLKGDLERTRLRCERFAQGFYSLNANIETVSMTSVDAIKSVANAMLRAHEAAKHEMLSAGLSPDKPAEQPDDIDTKAMGEKYGAGHGDKAEAA